jgi:cell division septum initiation protein DivIVA
MESKKMTKEELEKEAVEYAEKINLQNVNISGVVRNHISQAYLAGAEPREKQIEIDAKQIRALQKQNGELTDRVRELEAQNKEIENYFVESAGYGRDKVRNFMDIVNKALKQKGERITELEKENARLATNEKSLLAERKIIAKENTEAKNLIEELASSLSVVGECDEEECELIDKAQKFINKPIF